MRSKKTPTMFKSSTLLGLAAHTAMGIAMGLAFSFVLTVVDSFHVRDLLAHSVDPKTTMIVFVGSFTFAFGIGATVTGFVFMMMQER